MIDLSRDQPAIVVSGLTKKFGSTTALRDLNLAIPAGMTFGLLGPNGAGKSTLIRTMMGQMPPDAGKVTVLGLDASTRPQALKQRIGYAPEFHHVYRWMRVREVIRFVRPFYPHWDDSLCDDLLSRFALPTKKRVRELSKGMLAKFGLLLALSHNPDLLILDEPTSGLDPLIREDFLESILCASRSKPPTIVFSSHHVDDVERIADVIGVIIRGQLVLHGASTDIRNQVQRIHAVLRDGCLPARSPAGTVWQRIQRREWLLTVCPAASDRLDEVLADPAVETADLQPLNLEQIFKDFARGDRERQQDLATVESM